MQDANRLEQADRDAQARHNEAESAQRASIDAQSRYLREQQAATIRSKRAEQAELARFEAQRSSASHTEPAGLVDAFADKLLIALEVVDLTQATSLATDTAHKDVHRAVDARRQQATVMHILCAEVDQTEQGWAGQLHIRDER